MNLPNKRQSGDTKHTFIHLLLSLCAALLVTAALLCVFSSLMCKVDIPLYMTVPIATISICIAILLAAILMAYLQKEKGLPFGVLIGAVLFVAVWISALVSGNTDFTSLATLKLIAFLASGAIGGTVGTVLKERQRKIH